MSTVRSRITQYAVSALPENHPDHDMFAITVDYIGEEMWAIRRNGRCLSDAGEWNYGPAESEDRDAWFASHRHTCARALSLAFDAADKVTVNGFTVAQALARTEATSPPSQPQTATVCTECGHPFGRAHPASGCEHITGGNGMGGLFLCGCEATR